MNWISFDVLQRLLDKVSLKEGRRKQDWVMWTPDLSG